MTFGMRCKEVYPSGLLLVVIPYQWLPAVTYSLNNMRWVPEAFTQGRYTFVEHEKNMMEDLNRRAGNP